MRRYKKTRTHASLVTKALKLKYFRLIIYFINTYIIIARIRLTASNRVLEFELNTRLEKCRVELRFFIIRVKSS